MGRGWLAIVIVATLVNGDAWAGGIGCALTDLEDREELDAYAAELRLRGPKALESVLAYYDVCVADAAEWQGKLDVDFENKDVAKSLDEANAAVERARAFVDKVAGQRDATVSRLYWFTDLAAATRAAAEGSKPIISLRMLGKLTDEYSCANSRYFRTALYSNKEVSNYLREHYVLHWQTVRPVPRVTIDFGDGRKLERTVTGNSAHYVLDAEGRPLDVLPGLYGPKAFCAWLTRSDSLTHACAIADGAEARQEKLLQYHDHRHKMIEKAFRADLAEVAPQLLPASSPPVELVSVQSEGKAAVESPPVSAANQRAVTKTQLEASIVAAAVLANERAVSKTAVESPIVDNILPSDIVLAAQDAELWGQIAALHSDEARLDESSIEVMRRENPDARLAGAAAYAKYRVEDPILRLARSFEIAIAIDTVKNEYLLHRRIHEWYCRREASDGVEALNERVYAELFLTPSSDPWLGLAPANTYTALTDGGVTATP